MKILSRSVPEFDIAVASAEGVAECWKNQYFTDGRWRYKGEKTYEAIIDAGNDIAAVVLAIGNKSWTHPFCACCSDYVDRAVVLSDERSTIICGACLSSMLEGVKA